MHSKGFGAYYGAKTESIGSEHSIFKQIKVEHV